MSATKKQKIKAGDDQLPVAEAVALPSAPTVSQSVHATKHTFAPVDGMHKLRASQSLRVVVEVYTNTIMTQANMGHLTAVPQIQVHEATAKRNAARWTATVARSIIQTNVDIISFGNKFNNFMKPMNIALDLIIHNQSVDGDSAIVAARKAAAAAEGRASLQTGLAILLRDVARHKANAETASSALLAFLADVDNDVSNFATDYGLVEAQYTGDKGELSHLSDEITSLNSALAKDVSMMGLGAAGTVVGILAIATGVLLEIPSGFTSTAIVVGGLVVTGGGAAAVVVGKTDFDKSSRDLRVATSRLVTLKAEVAIAEVLKQNITNLQTTGGHAKHAIDQMVAQWQVLETSMQGVHDDFDNVHLTSAVFIGKELKVGADSWREMQQQASLIEDQMIACRSVTFNRVSEIGQDGPLPAPPTIAVLANPLVVDALTMGADAVDETASGGDLVGAMLHLEGDVADLHGAIIGPDRSPLPSAEQLLSNVPSLRDNEKILRARLVSLADSNSQLNALASEPHNQLFHVAAQSFLVDLEAGVAVAKEVQTISAGIHKLSQTLTTKTLGLISTGNMMVAADKVAILSLQVEIAAGNERIHHHRDSHVSIYGAFGARRAVSLAEKLGFFVPSLYQQRKEVENETADMVSKQHDLEKLQAHLGWAIAVHAAASAVTSSSLNVTTILQNIQSAFAVALESPPIAGPFASTVLLTITQDFCFIGKLVNGAPPLPLAHALLGSATRIALSAPAAAPVECIGAPATTMSLLSGGSHALADIRALLGDLCGQVWIGGGASLVVDSQPRLSLSLLPTIGETQALAASHAQEWARTVRKEIIDVTIGVRGFSAASEGAISVMLELIRTEAGDKCLETELLQGIEILSSRLETLTDVLTNGAAGAIPAVYLMRQEINNDTIRVGSLRMQLSNTYTGPDGEIARMKATVEASSTQITAMNKAIANRATSQLGEFYKQGFIIAAGVGLVSVGVPLGPVIGGIASTATVATCSKFATRAVNAAGKSITSSGSETALETINGSDQHDVAAAIDQYGAELVQLQHDELQVGAFLMLAQSVKELDSSVGETALILMKLYVRVASLASELKVLRVLIRDKSSARAVKDKLVAMKAGHREIQLNAKAATKSIIFSA